MNERLKTLRHSASHVLAQAVQHLYPNVKLGIGPAIENGFYYDFDLDTKLTEKDLVKIEQEMVRIIKEKQTYKLTYRTKSEAVKLLKQQNQTYKLELINSLDLDTYSFYTNGPFVDLCKGPHIENTQEITNIKLLSIAGAYWKGNEQNKMLQRIYGTCFEHRKELNIYLKNREEALKRDHRLLGKALDLFDIDENIGPGLILWHPKGTFLKNKIEDEWKKDHVLKNYKLIQTPHIGKSSLWETSGHLDFYKDNMYGGTLVDEQSYYIKPMNCPFHIKVYEKNLKSYKDLPYKIAELGTVYRNERSGVLHGLMRARGFTQDDAHIFCTKEQVNTQIKEILNLAISTLKQYGFETFNAFLSTKPEQKFVGENKDWKIAEKALEKALNEENIPFKIDNGGGAFYGPKIDLKIKDSLNREWQCSTIQFDFNLPKRFNLSFINSEGKKETPYMIHRAIFGSLERFLGILIEHYNGEFPIKLSPIQVKILSIQDSCVDYCKELESELKTNFIRTELDVSDNKISKKVKTAINEKIPIMIIIGKNEVTNRTITVRNKKQTLEIKTVKEIINLINSFDKKDKQ